jgi:hypothetical protein
MVPGRIFRHEQFYLDRDTGLLRPKYFLVLAVQSSGDCVARLLTSRAHGRPEDPPCFHGTPYPGFFLDVLDCAARADDTTRNQERAIRAEIEQRRGLE